MTYVPGGGGGEISLPFGTHFATADTNVGLRYGAYTGAAISCVASPTNFLFPASPALQLERVSYGLINNATQLTFSPAQDITIGGWGSTFVIPNGGAGVGEIVVGAAITPGVLANLRMSVPVGLGVNGLLQLIWWCTIL